MILLVYGIACLAFCASFVLLGILSRTKREFSQLSSELAVLRSSGMTDDEKERHARQAGLRAIEGSGALILRLAVAAAATVAPVWLADAAGLAPAEAVTRFALRLDVLIGTTVVLLLLVAVVRRRGARRP